MEMETEQKRGPGRPKKQEVETEAESTKIDSMTKFQVAFTIAQQTGEDLEVSEQVYKTLTQSCPGPFLMMGTPAVRIFQEGTKEAVLKTLG